MAGRHGLGSSLYIARSSVVHRLSPQCKLLATFLFVLVVVATRQGLGELLSRSALPMREAA